MRILLVAYFFEAPAGGGIIVARLLRDQLAARGHAVDVLCLDGLPERQAGRIWRLPPPRWARGRLDRFRQILLFLNNRAFDRHFLARALEQPLAAQKYDFVLAQDFLGIRVARTLADTLALPCGGTLHDTLPEQVEVGAPHAPVRRLLRALSLRRDRSLVPDLRRFHWLAAVSGHVRDSAVRWLHPASPPIAVVYNPAPDAFFRVPPPPSDPTIRFLFVGRLSPEKGVDLLVEAFRSTSGPSRLTVLGLAGSLEGKVRELARGDDRISLRAAVPFEEMPAVYATHHAVCCPVMWDEPFGLTVLEGRVTRRVVIGTRRGGLPEILAGYPRAQLFEAAAGQRSETIRRLTTALDSTAGTLGTPLDEGAENAFLNQFRLPVVVDRYEELILQSLPSGASR